MHSPDTRDQIEKIYENIKLSRCVIFKNKFPLHVKHEAIELARKEGIKRASLLLNIHRKNIDRWMNKGFFHKKGGGRKTKDPEMENNIINKANEYMNTHKEMPPRFLVRSLARLYINDSFKASKGWCDKFMRRNRLKFRTYLEGVQKQAITKCNDV